MNDIEEMTKIIREKTDEKMNKIEKKTNEYILKRLREIVWAINWAEENHEEAENIREKNIINSVAFERIEHEIWRLLNEEEDIFL